MPVILIFPFEGLGQFISGTDTETRKICLVTDGKTHLQSTQVLSELWKNSKLIHSDLIRLVLFESDLLVYLERVTLLDAAMVLWLVNIPCWSEDPGIVILAETNLTPCWPNLCSGPVFMWV